MDRRDTIGRIGGIGDVAADINKASWAVRILPATHVRSSPESYDGSNRSVHDI